MRKGARSARRLGPCARPTACETGKERMALVSALRSGERAKRNAASNPIEHMIARGIAHYA